MKTQVGVAHSGCGEGQRQNETTGAVRMAILMIRAAANCLFDLTACCSGPEQTTASVSA
jgi:hypothetical protein